MAASLFAHKFQGTLCHVKKARHVGRHVDRIVVRRIKREWLCHEHAGIVNQRVETTELLKGRFEHSLGCVRSPDVTLYGHDVRIGDRLDRPGCCNNAVVAIPENRKDSGTDPLRSSCYYSYFLPCAHDLPHSTKKLRLSTLMWQPLELGRLEGLAFGLLVISAASGSNAPFPADVAQRASCRSAPRWP